MIWNFLHKFSIFVIYCFGVSVFVVYLYLVNTINLIEQHVLFDATSAIKLNYDVIIVGAGTAGLTIAAGVKSNSVLIIEAGNDLSTPKAPISSTFATLLHTIPIVTPLLQLQDTFDWQYRTKPQKNACKALVNGVSHWPMGKGFGGTQLINNMIYYRGHENDFRYWFGDDSAAEYNFTKDILPYFREFEQYVELADLRYTTKLADVFQESLADSFDEIASCEFLQPKVLQLSGRRWTVADSYHRQHEKQQILLNAQVERILFDADGDTQTSHKAIGVSYRQNGRLYEVYASSAVILSAGTIATPSILLKSGIGPKTLYDSSKNKTHTDTHNNLLRIKLRKHLPAVGQHLQDHVTTGLDLIVMNQSLGLEPWNLYSLRQLREYFMNGQGPLTMGGCEGLGFIRTIFANDTEALPDLGFMVIPMGTTIDAGVYFRRILNLNEKTWQHYFKPLISTPTISILPIVLHPKSRGFVSLKAIRGDGIETVIDPRYLSHPDDINVLVIGLRVIEKLIETPAFKALGCLLNRKPFPGCEHESFASVGYWKCYVQHLTLTAYHPVGTSRLGVNSNDSVVQPSTFQVHGIERLYVCDASVMPTMPSGNPQAVVGMLARKFLSSFNRQFTAAYDDFLQKINAELT